MPVSCNKTGFHQFHIVVQTTPNQNLDLSERVKKRNSGLDKTAASLLKAHPFVQKGMDIDTDGRSKHKLTCSGKEAGAAAASPEQPAPESRPLGSRPIETFQWLQVCCFLPHASSMTRINGLEGSCGHNP